MYTCATKRARRCARRHDTRRGSRRGQINETHANSGSQLSLSANGFRTLDYDTMCQLSDSPIFKILRYYVTRDKKMNSYVSESFGCQEASFIKMYFKENEACMRTRGKEISHFGRYHIIKLSFLLSVENLLFSSLGFFVILIRY